MNTHTDLQPAETLATNTWQSIFCCHIDGNQLFQPQGFDPHGPPRQLVGTSCCNNEYSSSQSTTTKIRNLDLKKMHRQRLPVPGTRLFACMCVVLDCDDLIEKCVLNRKWKSSCTGFRMGDANEEIHSICSGRFFVTSGKLG